MNKRFYLLLVTPLLLSGCSFDFSSNTNDGQANNTLPQNNEPQNNNSGDNNNTSDEVNEAEIKLADGTTTRLTNEQMSEEEYSALSRKLPTVSYFERFDYTFDVYKEKGVEYNLSFSGIEAYDAHADIYTAKNNKYEFASAAYITTLPNTEIRSFQRTRYLLSDNVLQCGYEDNRNDFDGFDSREAKEHITYANPNKRQEYPTNNQGDPSAFGITVSRGIYEVLNSKYYLTLYGYIDRTLRFMSEENTSYPDPITHSHRLTNTHLIIEQNSMGFPHDYNETISQTESAIQNHINKLKDNNCYCKYTFYYSLETGMLEKTIIDFDTVLYQNSFGAMAGKLVLNNHFSFDYAREQIKNELERFLTFDGVVEVSRDTYNGDE